MINANLNEFNSEERSKIMFLQRLTISIFITDLENALNQFEISLNDILLNLLIFRDVRNINHRPQDSFVNDIERFTPLRNDDRSIAFHHCQMPYTSTPRMILVFTTTATPIFSRINFLSLLACAQEKRGVQKICYTISKVSTSSIADLAFLI